MSFLVLVVLLAAAVYIGWRVFKARADRPKPRTIGPDDDPEFLWRLNHPDNKPRT
ncbi:MULTISPECIES: hypothetical protein [Mycolicibacterium]|uniref:Uncharacterized protein n=2 Tax=Mycolicibacterium TaxID=1866885 RepID=A0A378TFG7_9MYCO|nr:MULTISPECIES: hypothetical protein [Mycolicibacterium]MCV7181891.1 hypothetical protein [Mycolicibacterium murale]BBY87206.1 hypothetical protein MTOK_29880 [Mycolicibacterium tokaiense]GFG61526.1 hypothetical protein MMUR_56620 [Mycolicibacterium murale]STZ58276.1 Uncharacterised protein [Mycolicibacterium tokaiense]